jgi:hypothetical protein
MREVVDRGATGVNAHFAGVQRLERLEAIAERIVEAYLGHIARYARTVILSEAQPGDKAPS